MKKIRGIRYNTISPATDPQGTERHYRTLIRVDSISALSRSELIIHKEQPFVPPSDTIMFPPEPIKLIRRDYRTAIYLSVTGQTQRRQSIDFPRRFLSVSPENYLISA